MLIADRYEIDDLPVGRGGMGAVHHGLDTHLGRRVAVKFLHLPAGSDEQRQRFVREARILARLEHPGAPILYDLGTHEHRMFQVMQFVDGVTVADVVAEHGPLPPGWAAAIGAQAAAVLAAAHDLEIVHRDLTPSNLMLRPDGSVVVLDFGLAVLAGAVRFTRMGQIFGTPSYMAPEQIQHGVADARTDLYALGCVMHELLTGTQLFAGPTAYAIFERQVREAPGPLPGTPAVLARVVLDLLAKDPADRPADAAVLHDRLAPLAVDLQPLPGFLAPDPGPGRRYACVWGGPPDPSVPAEIPPNGSAAWDPSFWSLASTPLGRDDAPPGKQAEQALLSRRVGIAPRRPAVDAARPVRLVTPSERTEGEQTPGMTREQAIAVDGMWAGLVRTEPQMLSGWHHHGDYDSSIYVVRGSLRMESGPGGSHVVEAGPGDFLHVPKGAIHREGNPGGEESHVVVVRAGHGPAVINVDGPPSG